ncbi:hypothetical protein HDR62_04010 [bacterium]|nr:hypothetical protein [bacterium]
MKRLLHLVLAATAVLLLVTACNKPTSETSQYVTDSHGRRLVSKIEQEFVAFNGKNDLSSLSFEYDEHQRIISIVQCFNNEIRESYQYKYFQDRIVVFIDGSDSIVYKKGINGRIDSCYRWENGRVVSTTHAISYDASGRLLEYQDDVDWFSRKYSWEKDLLSIIKDGQGREEYYTYLSNRENRTNICFLKGFEYSDHPIYMVEGYFSNFCKRFPTEITIKYPEHSEEFHHVFEYSFSDDNFIESFIEFNVDGEGDVHTKVSYLKK